MNKEPWNPDPLIRLQIGFALVAAMGIAIWIINGQHAVGSQKVVRFVVCFIGGAGLLATTLLRLAGSNNKRK